MKKLRSNLFYISQVLELLGKERRRLPLFLLMFLGASIIETMGLGMVIPFVGILVNQEATMDLFFIDWLTDLGVSLDQKSLILFFGLILVATFILKGVLAVAINGSISYFGAQQKIILSDRMIQAYLSIPYSDHIKRNTAEYLNSLTWHIGGFTSTIALSMKVISECLVFLNFYILLAYTNGPALLSLTGILIVFFLIHSRYFMSQFHQIGTYTRKTYIVRGGFGKFSELGRIMINHTVGFILIPL
jgi:ATP-binding cassette, subfamily B, bacterial PglK